MPEPFPVVVGPAEAIAPSKALAIFPSISTGAVLGKVGEDAERATCANQWNAFCHIQPILLGDKPQRCLVFVHVLQANPEADLPELA